MGCLLPGADVSLDLVWVPDWGKPADAPSRFAFIAFLRDQLPRLPPSEPTAQLFSAAAKRELQPLLDPLAEPCSKCSAPLPGGHSSPTCSRQVAGMLASVAIVDRLRCREASRTCSSCPASHERVVHGEHGYQFHQSSEVISRILASAQFIRLCWPFKVSVSIRMQIADSGLRFRVLWRFHKNLLLALFSEFRTPVHFCIALSAAVVAFLYELALECVTRWQNVSTMISSSISMQYDRL